MLVLLSGTEHVSNYIICAGSQRGQICLVRDLLYADDCDLVAHTIQRIQQFMDRLPHSCKAFSLSISLDKTVVMFQPDPGKKYIEPSIYVDGHRLKIVDSFVYLGSTLNHHCSLDDGKHFGLKKASDTFASLKDRVWSQKCIKSKRRQKFTMLVY